MHLNTFCARLNERATSYFVPIPSKQSQIFHNLCIYLVIFIFLICFGGIRKFCSIANSQLTSLQQPDTSSLQDYQFATNEFTQTSIPRSKIHEPQQFYYTSFLNPWAETSKHFIISCKLIILEWTHIRWGGGELVGCEFAMERNLCNSLRLHIIQFWSSHSLIFNWQASVELMYPWWDQTNLMCHQSI